MKKPSSLVLSLAAGLLGGVLSHYVWTQPVHAQSLASAPSEIRAQSFVLVDNKGVVEGVLSFDQPNKRVPATIKLLDGTGREIWRAGGMGSGMRLIASPAKPN